MAKLGLEAFEVATQTYPRKQDWFVLNALAGLSASLHKFAFDLRILQSPPFGEWSEPFGAKQVGSSAMPFKRNPIAAENIDSLTRLVAAMPRTMWDNAALSLLERTLDDSANRRFVLPEAFLITDEVLARGRASGRGDAFLVGTDRAQSARLRPLCRHRAGVDGCGQGRRRPPGTARGDPRAQPDGLGRLAGWASESAAGVAGRRPAHHQLGFPRTTCRQCWMRPTMSGTRPSGQWRWRRRFGQRWRSGNSITRIASKTGWHVPPRF